MMPVAAIAQGFEDLENAAAVNEKEGEDRQCARRADGAGGGSTQMLDMAPGQQADDFADWNEAQQIAEQDEKKQRPEKRKKPIRIFLQRRADDFNA